MLLLARDELVAAAVDVELATMLVDIVDSGSVAISWASLSLSSVIVVVYRGGGGDREGDVGGDEGGDDKDGAGDSQWELILTTDSLYPVFNVFCRPYQGLSFSRIWRCKDCLGINKACRLARLFSSTRLESLMSSPRSDNCARPG